MKTAQTMVLEWNFNSERFPLATKKKIQKLAFNESFKRTQKKKEKEIFLETLVPNSPFHVSKFLNSTE